MQHPTPITQHPTPNTQHPTPNLVLIGFMGTGKTTLGRLCAAQLGFTFCDSDQIIEARAGCSVAELFRAQGEAVFRQREREVIAEFAATSGLVIATGGGAALDAANVEHLRRTGFVVLLTATPDIILRRVGYRRNRPLLAGAPDPRARVEEMLAARMPLYRKAAHCQIETDLSPAREMAQRILLLYEVTQTLMP